MAKATLIICNNHRVNPNKPSCGQRGSQHLQSCVQAYITQQKLDVHVETFKCLGHCEKGPNMKLVPNGKFFYGVTEESLGEVLASLDNQ